MNVTERQVLDLLATKLVADGYDVFVEPPSDLLPGFMQGYRPDAIALGKKKKLAIEVISGATSDARKAIDLQKRFADAADWELMVYHAPRSSASDVLPAPSTAEIDMALDSVHRLREAGQKSAALLIGWAYLEALARIQQPERFDRPQPAGALVEGLAQDGVITPEEAARLRRIGGLRNRITHGDLSAAVSDDDLSALLAIGRTIGLQLSNPPY